MEEFKPMTLKELDEWCKEHPSPYDVGEKDVTKGTWYISNTWKDKNAWHLTDSKEDEGTYSLQIKYPMDIVFCLAHMTTKGWVDMEKLFIGLLPAIKYFYIHKQGKRTC